MNTTDEFQQAGRLALRQEGDKWVAYYALPDTMDDALWLGSIRMSIVGSPVYREMFMLMMRHAVSEILADANHPEIHWGGEQSAPEHERGKGGPK
jgi:hypothetical protein